MQSYRCTAAVFALSILTSGIAAAETLEGSVLPLKTPGGFAVLPDGVTLVVSQPDAGELVYFDTVLEEETRRVAVDFKPTAMAIQGNRLFVAAKGASLVYVLDAKTGAQQREVSLDEEAVVNLACHPTKGLVYATTASYAVYSIKPATGAATKTRAVGSFIAMDPVDGAAVYTGVQPPQRREIIIEDLPGGVIRIYSDRWGVRAFMLKYELNGDDLKLVSSQTNAACNAYTMSITADGKKLLMTSGGGWRPPVEGGTGGDYICAAFSTTNLEKRMGELPAGSSMAFHPVLNIGVLNQSGRNLQFFNPKSFVLGELISVSETGDSTSLLLTFAAKGTKVILWNGGDPNNPREGVHFSSLELTDSDLEALKKKYGKIPAVASNVPETKATPGGTKPSSTKPETDDPAPSPDGVIASAGFNDAKGINSTASKNSPYRLGQSNIPGGRGEKGWQGEWPAHPKAMFVTEDVAEGDGAVFLLPTIGYKRSLSKPLKGKFAVEMSVRWPEGGGGGCYIYESAYTSTGPMWRVTQGKFSGLNGNAQGRGDWKDVGECEPDKWHQVRLLVDQAQQSWTMAVDDQENDHKFAFRYTPTRLQTIDFLVEGNEKLYIDAIRFLKVDEK